MDFGLTLQDGCPLPFNMWPTGNQTTNDEQSRSPVTVVTGCDPAALTACRFVQMLLNAAAMLASPRGDTSRRWSSMLTKTARLPSSLSLQGGIMGHEDVRRINVFSTRLILE